MRRTAIAQLAQQFKDDPDLFDILFQCAKNDSFERQDFRVTNTRQIALEYLVELFPNHPQLKGILQDRLENDPDEKVREYVQSVIDKI